MVNVDQAEWQAYSADPGFQRYLGACKAFDPVGIERALNTDAESGSVDFHRVIIAAYLEDCAVGAVSA